MPAEAQPARRRALPALPHRGAGRRRNPLADRWLVWPERDAHVLVIAEQLQPGVSVDMERFAEVVLGNARRGAPDVKLVDRQPLPGGATRLHTTSTVNGVAVESYYGLFASGPWIFQVIAFSGRERFSAVEPDLRGILESFEPPRIRGATASRDAGTR